MTRDYEKAIRFLESRTNYERFVSIPYDRMGKNLQRLARFVDYLEIEHRTRVIHIAGTKGKGSTAILIEKIFRDRGARTGLFTSPHLFCWEERFALDGAACSESDLTETLLTLEERLAVFEKTDPSDIPLTTFELTIAAAFLLFAKKKCDLVILETGLGGRIDATNICSPSLCILTSLGYEHQKQLGRTLTEIAAEKGGIIKPGVPVISGIGIDSGRLPTEACTAHMPVFLRRDTVTLEAIHIAQEVIKRIARENNAPLTELDRVDSDVEEATRQLIGGVQKRNAQIAVAAAEILSAQGFFPGSYRAALDSLRHIKLPARGEIVRHAPLWLIDGAHTRDSAASVAEAVTTVAVKRRTLVFSALAEKDVEGMLWELLPKFDCVILTEIPGMPRRMAADELLNRARKVAASLPPDRIPPIRAEADLSYLLGVLQLLPPDELVCFTGSFYLASLAASAPKK